jgi:hypothetical protein
LVIAQGRTSAIVRGIAVIFGANELRDFVAGRSEGRGEGTLPRSGERFRIVHDDLDLQMAVIGTADALYRMQFLGVRNAGERQPAFVVISGGVYDQSVAFPMPNGMPFPCRVHILGMPAAIEKDLAVARSVRFVENDDQRKSLNEFVRERPRMGAALAGRQNPPG